MDTSKAINHISLCAGYGGIDLGLRRVFPTCRTVAYVEIEAFAVANLVAKMEEGELDSAPIWTNLKTLPLEAFPTGLEIISGGFPCQPFSAAGKREGDEDPRHRFPYIKNAIRTIQPRIVFLENVEGIISAKLKGDGWEDPAGTPVLLHVIRELERVGYHATAGVFSAAEVGAPHQRKRVFILGRRINKLGDPECKGLEGLGNEAGEGQEGWQKEGGPVAPSNCSIKSMADPNGTRDSGSRNELGVACEAGQRGKDSAEDCFSGEKELAHANECRGQQDSRSGELRTSGVEQSPCHRWPSRPGEAQQEWEEPRVVADAHSNESASIRGDNGEVFKVSTEQGQEHCAVVSRGEGEESSKRQTESQLGGATDGSTSGLDATINRVDRLRLLGNGVVPDTAEVAFRTLYKELMDEQQSNQS